MATSAVAPIVVAESSSSFLRSSTCSSTTAAMPAGASPSSLPSNTTADPPSNTTSTAPAITTLLPNNHHHHQYSTENAPAATVHHIIGMEMGDQPSKAHLPQSQQEEETQPSMMNMESPASSESRIPTAALEEGEASIPVMETSSSAVAAATSRKRSAPEDLVNGTDNATSQAATAVKEPSQKKPKKPIVALHFELSDKPEAPSVAERDLPPAGLVLSEIHSVLSPVGEEAVGQDNITSQDILHIGNATDANSPNNLDFYGRPRPRNLIRKWPSMLMYLMSQSTDDEWTAVRERIRTHPDEIAIAGVNGGMNALHAACVRYPPLVVIEDLLEANPSVVVKRNFNGETPLHIASYSASEEVQSLLVQTVPQAASLLDQYGDSPLHFAARAGATYNLLQEFLKACPRMISQPNERGVTPFWLLPRSYLESDELNEEVLDHEYGEDYRDDWDSLALVLRYAYHQVQHDQAQQQQQKESPAVASATKNETTTTTPLPPLELPQVRDEDGMPLPIEASDYSSWMVHAAAATPSCPREVLKWLCRMFPEQALLKTGVAGYTPLLWACQSRELIEPHSNWNQIEDGMREHVDATEGELQNQGDVLEESERRLGVGNAAFLEQIFQQPATAQVSVDGSGSRSNGGALRESVVELLLEWSPKSALIPDHQGRLPLTHALVNGLTWEASIAKLIAACPRALECRDPVTGLYNFQLAAMCSPQLDTVYSLVRSLPELLTSYCGGVDEDHLPSSAIPPVLGKRKNDADYEDAPPPDQLNTDSPTKKCKTSSP